MPRKWVEERDPSPDARCGRWDEFLEGYCAAPMELAFTRSAFEFRPWKAYIIERCLSGHIHHAQGVALDLNVFAGDDDDTGAIGL